MSNCCSSKTFLPFLFGVLFSFLIIALVFFMWQYFLNKENTQNIIEIKNEEAENVEENLMSSKEVEIKFEVGELEEENNNLTFEKDIIYPEDTFTEDNNGNFFGRLTLTGYPVIEQYSNASCDPNLVDGCRDIFYVKFMIIGQMNPALKKYADEQIGNSFIGENWIGLGCKDTFFQTLSFYNSSDENEMSYFLLEEDDSEKFFSASQLKPITITVEKKILTMGGEAPKCYSHFSSLKLW